MESYSAHNHLTPLTIPAELRQRSQWVAWRYNQGGSKKRPIDPTTGREIPWTKPDSWLSYEEADALASEHGWDGVGFVFTARDPLCGVDLDDCINPKTGEVHPAAEEIIAKLRSYAEISPSGTGIKVFARAVKSRGRCSTTDTPWGGKFEMYDRGRFFAVTGRAYGQAPIRDAQDALGGLSEQFLTEPMPDHAAEVIPLGKTARSDDEVLWRARGNSKTGERFSFLYGSGSTVPKGERSEADYFVVKGLVIASGGDAEQVKRLFRRSDLVHGHYADAGHHAESYLERTVSNATSEVKAKYDLDRGPRMKGMVREAVRAYREKLASSDLRYSCLTVMEEIVRIAEEVGSYQEKGVEFNANQEAIAEAVGVSQRMVSKNLKSLRADGWLVRLSLGTPGRRGKAGKNSKYRLPITRDGEVGE